jgi:hypothetical protein
MIQLGNMTKAIGTRNDLHKGAKLGDTSDTSLVNSTDFRLLDNLVNDVDRHLRALIVRRSDIDRTIIFDVNLNACALNDAPDDFSTGTDHFSYLVRLHFDREDSRCVRREILPWFFHGEGHLA